MPSAGGLYLTGGCDFLICGTFAVTVFTLCGVSELPGWKWKFMSDLCKLRLLPLPRPRFCQSPLACLSRVHFSRYPSRLSDLHLILMFSGPLQQDLFKEKWSLAKCTSNKIIVTLVTQGLPSSSLCRPLASTLATWAWESCDVRVTLFIVFDV